MESTLRKKKTAAATIIVRKEKKLNPKYSRRKIELSRINAAIPVGENTGF